MVELTGRERELLDTMVSLMEPGDIDSFELGPGDGAVWRERWPAGVRTPTREEIRALRHRHLLEIDSTAPQGVWRFWPTAEARAIFQGDAARERAEALRDPDARLGLILDAVVAAFEQDPSTPLLLIRTDQVDIVRHAKWPIEPDVVRMHDLRQLEGLGLIGWDDTSFFPTLQGRMASRNPAAFLSMRADEVGDPEEKSRLRSMAEKLRAGDLAVSTAGGVTGAALRAVLGL